MGAYIGVAVLLIAWAVMPFSISRSVRSTDLSIRSLDTGSRVAQMLTAILTSITILVLVFGATIVAQPARVKHTNYLVITSTLGPWFIAVSSALIVISGISLLGTLAARRAYWRALVLS